MKLWNRIITGALSLALMLSAAACGPTGTEGASSGAQNSSAGNAAENSSNITNANTPMGRYVEDVLPLPEEIAVNAYSFAKARSGPDGIHLYNPLAGETALAGVEDWFSADGRSWKKQSDSWLSDAQTKAGGIAEFIDAQIGGDGTAYLLIRDPAKELRLFFSKDGKTASELVIPSWKEKTDGNASGGDGAIYIDGGKVEVEAPSAEVDGSDGQAGTPENTAASTSMRPSHIFLADNGNIIICYMDGGAVAVEYDGTTGDIVSKSPEGSYFGPLMVKGNTLYTMDYMANKIISYNMDNGMQEREIACENTVASFANNMLSGADGDLVVANSGGIHRIADGGSIWETLMDGSLSILGSPALSLIGFLSDGADGYYLLYANGEDSYQLTHAYYNPSIASTPDQELKVYALTSSPTVRQAISDFQLSNPNVRVNLQIGMPEESSATVEDVIRALNTELLAGRGPDVLILDGLPVDSYIEKGVLADLTELLKDMRSSMFENVANTLSRDGKLYGIPTRFNVPLLFGSQELLDQLNSLSDISAYKGTQKLLTITNEPSELLEMLMPASYPAWIGTDGKTLDTDKLTEFLQQAQKIFDTYKPAESDMASMVVGSSTSGGGNPIMLNSGYFDFTSGKIGLYPAEVVGFMHLNMPLGSYSNDAVTQKAAYEPMPGQNGNVYVPEAMAGINAAGKQQELAGQFIQTLLSSSVQKYDFADGFPVLLSVFQQQMAKQKEDVTIPSDFPDLLSSLKTPLMPDRVLWDTVQEQAVKLLKGEQTLEQTVQSIRSKAELRMAE